MAEPIFYRDHKIASFSHRTEGEFTIVRKPAPGGKYQRHAAWRCRGVDHEAAKSWIDEQLNESE